MVNSEQHEVIGWRDPSEVVDDTPKRNPRKSVPCFSISCTNDDTRSKIMQQIQALNGRLCYNLQKYDSACTHFVCEKPSRSEKMFSCVAAGKWVLSLSYVEKSYEANHFLDVRRILCEWNLTFLIELNFHAMISFSLDIRKKNLNGEIQKQRIYRTLKALKKWLQRQHIAGAKSYNRF